MTHYILKSIISWNNRGCNKLSRQVLAKDLIKSNRADIVIFQDTKVEDNKLIRVKNLVWKQANLDSISSIGNQNSYVSLWILWDPRTVLMIRILSNSRRGISTRIVDKKGGFSFILTNIYAP